MASISVAAPGLLWCLGGFFLSFFWWNWRNFFDDEASRWVEEGGRLLSPKQTFKAKVDPGIGRRCGTLGLEGVRGQQTSSVIEVCEVWVFLQACIFSLKI